VANQSVIITGIILVLRTIKKRIVQTEGSSSHVAMERAVPEDQRHFNFTGT
jgi:hypothetical protein